MEQNLINQQIKENQELLAKIINENPAIRDYYCNIAVTLHFFDITDATAYTLNYIECLNLDYYKFYTGSTKINVFDIYTKNTIYEFRKNHPDSLITDITINVKPVNPISVFNNFNLLSDRRSSLNGTALLYLKSLV